MSAREAAARGEYSDWLERHCYACGQPFTEHERELLRRSDQGDEEADRELVALANEEGCELCGKLLPELPKPTERRAP